MKNILLVLTAVTILMVTVPSSAQYGGVMPPSISGINPYSGNNDGGQWRNNNWRDGSANDWRSNNWREDRTDDWRRQNWRNEQTEDWRPHNRREDNSKDTVEKDTKKTDSYDGDCFGSPNSSTDYSSKPCR